VQLVFHDFFKCFLFKIIFLYFQINFLMFYIKIDFFLYYFNTFSNKKLFKKQSLLQSHTSHLITIYLLLANIKKITCHLSYAFNKKTCMFYVFSVFCNTIHDIFFIKYQNL
jgi:hypothetical protein